MSLNGTSYQAGQRLAKPTHGQFDAAIAAALDSASAARDALIGMGLLIENIPDRVLTVNGKYLTFHGKYLTLGARA